jgi:hypothetical protein
VEPVHRAGQNRAAIHVLPHARRRINTSAIHTAMMNAN